MAEGYARTEYKSRSPAGGKRSAGKVSEAEPCVGTWGDAVGSLERGRVAELGVAAGVRVGAEVVVAAASRSLFFLSEKRCG